MKKDSREFLYSIILSAAIVTVILSLSYWVLGTATNNAIGTFVNHSAWGRGVGSLIIFSMWLAFTYYGGWGAGNRIKYNYLWAFGYFFIFFPIVFFPSLSVFGLGASGCLTPYILISLLITFFVGRGVYHKHIKENEIPAHD